MEDRDLRLDRDLDSDGRDLDSEHTSLLPSRRHLQKGRHVGLAATLTTLMLLVAVAFVWRTLSIPRSAPPTIDTRVVQQIPSLSPVADGRPSRGWQQVLSARDTPDRLTRKHSIPLEEDFDSAVAITIDSNIEFQRIMGFGGAITDAAATVLSQMSERLLQRVIDLYYGPDGNRYTIGRLHINSCDFSPFSYTFDDVADDFSLEHFDTSVTHDAKHMLPLIRRAINATGGKLRLFAAPWSPPAWMKVSEQMTGSSSPCLKPDPRYHEAWALYLARFLQAYEKQGVNIWGLSVQNEPEFAAPWEACVYTAVEQRDFIKNHLGPVLARERPRTRLMIYDHNKDHIVKWASTILSDPDAARYVWGTAFHWYSGDSFDHLTTVHQSFPDKHLLASEACNCPGVELGNWARGEAYGHDIIGDLNNYAVGWTDWNIVLDPKGGPNHLNNMCDAPIIADAVNQTLHVQPTYFFMGHFSRFLPPGSVRVLSTVTGSPDMEVTVFRTPARQLVAIVLNRSDYVSVFKLKLAAASDAARVRLGPHSIVTLTLDL